MQPANTVHVNQLKEHSLTKNWDPLGKCYVEAITYSPGRIMYKKKVCLYIVNIIIFKEYM